MDSDHRNLAKEDVESNIISFHEFFSTKKLIFFTFLLKFNSGKISNL